MPMKSAASPETALLAGQHLTFVVGREHYGVPVLKVKNTVKTLLDIDRVVSAVNPGSLPAVQK